LAGATTKKAVGGSEAGRQVRIGVGSTVTLATPDGEGKAIEFTMVEREDSDPTRGRISVEAPVARAVVGREIGEEVVVPAPRGERRYRIVSARIVSAA
jgi:transcription elongation factor GreA